LRVRGARARTGRSFDFVHRAAPMSAASVTHFIVTGLSDAGCTPRERDVPDATMTRVLQQMSTSTCDRRSHFEDTCYQ
jgi:hypothetical protein